MFESEQKVDNQHCKGNSMVPSTVNYDHSAILNLIYISVEPLNLLSINTTGQNRNGVYC